MAAFVAITSGKDFEKMKEKPILSISMLISGREEMKKSLDSLHYFTEAFPCEIILTDTGCNPEQRALAEQYADKILEFEWCGDFSAARNVGLKEARGEWFMYLDDDEWFDNPREIVSFFTTGEYKKYKCATYVQRNYHDEQGIMYDDSYPSRMIELSSRTKFVGRIHELLTPYEQPKKEFNDFVHHYGYVYKDMAEMRKHAERNIVPLLEMRKEHKGDPRWMCQLAQEYFGIEEYEKTFQTCKEGLEEWAGMTHEFIYAPSHIGALYGFLLSALELLKRYDEEEEWLKKAFADSHMEMEFMQPNLAFFCLMGAKLYNIKRDHKQCADYFRRYMDYVKRLKGDRKILEDGAALITALVFQETFLYGVVLSCMESAILMEDYKLAEDAFYQLDWQDPRLLMQHEPEGKMVDAMCSVACHPTWGKILQTLVSRPQGMKEMQVVFLQKEIEYKQQGGEAGKEKLSRLYRLVAGLDYDHRYILYGKIRWAEEDPSIPSEEERREKIAERFAELFDKCGSELLEVKAEIWDVAGRQGVPVEDMLVKTDYRSWRRGVERWRNTAEVWELNQWKARAEEWRRKAGTPGDTPGEAHTKLWIYCSLLIIKCEEGLLRRHREVYPSLEQMENAFRQYGDDVLAFCGLYYEGSVFDEMPELLPDEAQLALAVREVLRCREDGDDRKALESMRRCLGVCPAVEEAVGAYATMYRDEVKRRTAEADKAQEELRHLIATLKETARRQIENGDCQAAREILLQVRACAPEDAEVQDLLRQIEEK